MCELCIRQRQTEKKNGGDIYCAIEVTRILLLEQHVDFYSFVFFLFIWICSADIFATNIYLCNGCRCHRTYTECIEEQKKREMNKILLLIHNSSIKSNKKAERHTFTATQLIHTGKIKLFICIMFIRMCVRRFGFISLHTCRME